MNDPRTVSESGSGSESRFSQKEIKYKRLRMNDCILDSQSNNPSEDPDAMNENERNSRRLRLRVNDCTLASQSNYPSEDPGSMNENERNSQTESESESGSRLKSKFTQKEIKTMRHLTALLNSLFFFIIMTLIILTTYVFILRCKIDSYEDTISKLSEDLENMKEMEMETDVTLPKRQIVSVTIIRNQSGNFHFLKLLFS